MFQILFSEDEAKKHILLISSLILIRFPFNCVSRNPDGVGIPVIRQAPRDLKIPTRFNLVQDRIARLRSDPVLRCQVRDAFSFIEFSVDQVVHRLEFH